MTSDASTLSETNDRPQSRLGRLVGSPWAWVTFFSLLFGYHIGRAVIFAETPPEPPKVYYQLPTFALTDQFNREFGSEDLRGKIWVANFIFTHCPTRCEELTKGMAALQKRLRHMRDGIHLVSFSVDPENDTPEVLAEYATKHKANQLRWRFLTGELDAVKEAVVGGFKLPMEKDDLPEETSDAFMTITHGTRYVLVDPALRIRGYYEGDEAGIEKLLKDIGYLSEREMMR